MPSAKLNRFRAPGTGIMVLAIPAAVLVFTSALNFLIIFAGTVIAAVYFCIGLAALWSRRSLPERATPVQDAAVAAAAADGRRIHRASPWRPRRRSTLSPRSS